MRTVKCVLMFLLTLPLAMVAQPKSEWPRVMVIMDEKIDTQEVEARLVASRMEEVLLDKGFRLVDKSQFENVRARDIALAVDNPARAKEIGMRYGAEWIIVGKSSATLDAEREFYGVKNFEYSSKGDARVIITDTGELIAVSSKTAKKSSQGKSSAANLSLESLGESLANEIFVKVRVRLKEESEGPKIVQLALIGISDKQALEYQQALTRTSPVFNTLKLRYFEKDAAVFEASVNGTMDDLRAELGKRDDLVVIGFTGSRIDLSTKEAADRAKGSAFLTSPLEIGDLSVENVFPSQVNYYAYNPLAQIAIENSAKTEIRNVKVSIFIPGYMTLPSEQIVPKIDAGAKQGFKLSATLDVKQLYAQSENTTAQAKVELSYSYNGQPQSRSLVKPVTIYGRNTINWKRPESVAAFITELDESVASFARFSIASIADKQLGSSTLPRQVQNAIAVWDGVRALGINYVSESWKATEQEVLDLVAYPRETLSSRTGNCSGSSVLLASCLENVGIRTKFLLTSDHIFFMFDTEVLPKNGFMISPNPKDYIVDEGTVWMPIEATMINKPFTIAWKTAADEYYKNTEGGGKIDIVDTRKARTTFPPANLAYATKPVTPPAAEKIVQFASQDLADIQSRATETANTESKNLAAAATPESKNKAAIIQSKAGNYDAAIQLLAGVATPQSYNTLGNIYLLKNDMALAQEHYQKSLQLDSNDGGVYLNFGLARFLAGSEEDAAESFQVAVSKFDSKEKAYQILGLDKINQALGTRGAEQSDRKISKNDLFALLNKSLQNIPSRDKSTSQAARVREKYKNEQNRFVFGGRRGADPTQIASVKEFLYWRE